MQFRFLVLVLALLSLVRLHSQNESNENIKLVNEGFRTSIRVNTQLNSKLSMQYALEFKRHLEFNEINSPLLLKYKLDDRWSLFGGGQLRYFESTNSNLLYSGVNPSLFIASRYNFNENGFGELKYEYNLSKEYNGISNFKKGTLKLNVGYTF